jgi:hypothetical protein
MTPGERRDPMSTMTVIQSVTSVNEKLAARIAMMNDDTLIDAARMVSVKNWMTRTTEERMVRAALVTAWGKRHGDDAEEELLDALEAIEQDA